MNFYKHTQNWYNEELFEGKIILSEKKRVEDFQVLYTYSLGFAAMSFLLTILAFGFMENRIFQSICIALLLLSVSLIIIDHFSKERAKIYFIEIQKQLESFPTKTTSHQQ